MRTSFLYILAAVMFAVGYFFFGHVIPRPVYAVLAVGSLVLAGLSEIVERRRQNEPSGQ